MSARQIYDRLSEHVTGQHELKKALAVAGRQILLRREIRLQGSSGNLPPKPNILAIGKSGSGKSYTCQRLCQILGLPFACMDLSSVTASGYVGDDLSGVLHLLAQAAYSMQVDPELGGLIYLDEADKVSSCAYDSATTTGVQFEMLRLLDGGQVSYPTVGMNKWGGSGAVMDSSGLLVVASGAFSWLSDYWKASKLGIGFRMDASQRRASDVCELLVSKGGWIPELVNRFNAIVRLDPLTPADIANILQNQFGPAAEYQASLAAERRSLSIEPAAALAIGRWSIEQNLQGRGPKAALELLLRESLPVTV